MSYAMEFPDTVDEFMEQYKMTDTECVYSNGIEYVPIFRMKQWFEHLKIKPSYDELLKAARAMHTWIFLHSGNEKLAYKACGLSDEMNAFLGYSGSFTLTDMSGGIYDGVDMYGREWKEEK